MKKHLLTILVACVTIQFATAQAPSQFKYQAVLRNGDGSIMASEAVSVDIQIVVSSPEGESVFYESHSVTTSPQGVINLTIGSVNTTGLAEIDWGADTYFIKVSVNGLEMGISQLLAVPYALHAKTADALTGELLETDPAFTAWDKSTGIEITESQISDLQTYLTEETDPTVTANFDFSDAANGDLLQFNGTQWVKVTPGYLTSYTETDPEFIAWDKSTGISITENQISDLQSYLTTESDPTVTTNFDFTGAANGDLLQFNGTQWVKVTPDYISGYTVTEGDVTAHQAALEITESQISDLPAYLTSETDPAVAANFDFTDAAIGDLLQFNGTKWVKVTPDYISGYTVTESDVTAHQAALEITESQISDLQTYLTEETDPAVTANFDFSDAAEGDLLQFNGTIWVKVTPDYISGYTVTETDVTAHQAALEITENQISDLQNYLTEETDPTVTANFDFTDAAEGDLLQFNGTKWVKVTPNYISDYTVTETDVTAHQAALEITESQISDLKNYLTNITGQPIGDLADVDLTGLAAGKILKYDSDIQKWVVADVSELTEESDPFFTAWDKTTGITISESQISDLQSYLTEEIDPAFTAWDKSTGIEITESQIADLQEYLIAETDPLWTSASTNYFTKTNMQTSGQAQLHWGNVTSKPTTISGYGITNAYTKTNMQTSGQAQLHFGNLTSRPTTVLGYGITDAMTTAHDANAITSANIAQWTSAYNWGNHASAGYLTAYTETDPVWSAASASYYTKTNMQTSGQAQLHWGNVTSKPTTLAGYGITNGLSTSLASTNIIVGSSTGVATARALSGDATLSNTGVLTLANSGVTASTYKSVTVDAKGRVTAGTNPTTIAGYGITDAYTKTNMQTSGQAQLHFGNLTNRPTTVVGYGITDAMTTSHQVNSINGTTAGQMLYWNGSAWVNVERGSTGQVLIFKDGKPTWGVIPSAGAGEVQNPKTGAIWMDRNLGATQVATSSTDAAAYGHLYQWGRGSDGHQIRTSGTTSTLSSSDTPGHANFILAPNSPYDWRSPQNTNLWQGISGVNNPCPAGYRLPTEAEWTYERASWSSDNATGAFSSPLKLSVAGYRLSNTGSLGGVGSLGNYWSSTLDGVNSRSIYFGSSGAGIGIGGRANGRSVRCLKE